MCGLAGYIGGRSVFSVSEAESALRKMGDQLLHRGPDDSGIWSDEDARVGIVHRRLSILDLASTGHQPMVSRGGRYIVAFNGEIYNHLDLKTQLEPEISHIINSGGKNQNNFPWRGTSDTEVLLAGFDIWGINETITRSVGMFALAIWDRSTRELTLVRDRLGEKPLYYGWQGDTFLFGSELKALKAHPDFNSDIDRSALTTFLRHNYIPTPYSIYKGINKLPPGSSLTVSLQKRDSKPIRYWDAYKIALAGLKTPFPGTTHEAVNILDNLLHEAVSKQMNSDVPLGAFLSGGVDSSMIVALMQSKSDFPVKTFTIGFNEREYDEAEYSKAVAKHLGTDHTELYVSPQKALEVIPSLPLIFDEPFSDSSQIPTYLIAQMTRRHVTVSLSGDAGDELFGGYNRYHKALRLRNQIPQLSGPIKSLLSNMSELMAKVDRSRDDKWWQLSDLIAAKTLAEFYRPRMSHWKRPERVVIDGKPLPTAFDDPSFHEGSIDNFPAIMMFMDIMTYLPDDILVKLDRASMANSLETRVPFLDHRVVEFAFRLPISMKIRAGESKWILRKLLHRYIPEELIDRPKKGFSIPIDSWLRGALRDWAESLLSETRLRDGGYLNPEPIRRKWSEHISGRCNWQYHLWDILMFQSWLEHAK